MDLHERKRIILAGQFLTRRAERRRVVRSLCGIQSQVTSHAYHALRIRCEEPLQPEMWGEGFSKTWSLRGTLHIILDEDIPLHRRGFDRYYNFMCSHGFPLERERALTIAEQVVRLISDGIFERDALKDHLKELGMTCEEEAHVFNGWGGLIRELAEDGRICYKAQEKKELRLCPPAEKVDPSQAQLELMRRYLAHYGPVALKDASYFFCVPQAKLRAYMEQLPCESVQIEGKTCFYIQREGDEGLGGDIPDCLLLGGFDPLMLGYEKYGSPFLPAEHVRGIFNLTGIVFPAILLHGRVVGKWKQDKQKLIFTPFESLAKKDRGKVEKKAQELFDGIKSIAWQEA